MASSKTNINPEVLTWARRTAGLTEDEAAKKLALKPERLDAWEQGVDRPTVKQLRKIAQIYKRPVSVFYLPEQPAGFQVLRDLRRLPGTGLRTYSPSLVYEMRLAQQRRELAIELLEDVGEDLPRFEMRAVLDDDPETLAYRIREAVDLTYSEQIKWGNPRGGVQCLARANRGHRCSRLSDYARRS